MNKIEVKTKPVIEYSIIESASKDVDEKIKSLSLETLEVNENSLVSVKKVRAELSKDFKVFEEQRKMVKDIILKPYNDFETKYKEMIASKFKDADKLLKDKIDVVADDILNQKINSIKEYFIEVNSYDFIKFEDLELKIIKSVTDKKLKEDIDSYLESICTSLNTIETLPNKDRVLAKFQMCKDLNVAISQTNIEIQREKEIEDQRRVREEAKAERENQESLRQQENEVVAEVEPIQEPTIKEQPQPQVYKTTFEVVGTKEQLRDLKEFLINNNIEYKGV